MNYETQEKFWAAIIGTGLVFLVIALNLATFALCVWLGAKILQLMGIL